MWLGAQESRGSLVESISPDSIFSAVPINQFIKFRLCYLQYN
jgi:hypothetical protein